MNNMELQNQNEKKYSQPLSSSAFSANRPQTLHFRCPTCSKLYEASTHLIKSSSPHFDCLVCGEVFSFSYPPSRTDQIETYRVENRNVASQKNHKVCPKCAALNMATATECYSCQIVFRNYELLKQENFPGVSPGLVSLWQQYVSDYENDEVQEKFILACRTTNQIPYAEAKLALLKSVMGEDDPICRKAFDRLQKYRQEKSQHIKQETAVQKSSLAKFDFKNYFLSLIKQRRIKYCAPVALAFLLITFGVLGSGHKNMVGPGVAILILHFGLIYTFKGRIDLADFVKK